MKGFEIPFAEGKVFVLVDSLIYDDDSFEQRTEMEERVNEVLQAARCGYSTENVFLGTGEES